MVGKAGIEPAVFTAWVADLQSAAIAAMLTCPNAFPLCQKLPETSKVYCEPQIAGTQYRQRALPAYLISNPTHQRVFHDTTLSESELRGNRRDL